MSRLAQPSQVARGTQPTRGSTLFCSVHSQNLFTEFTGIPHMRYCSTGPAPCFTLSRLPGQKRACSASLTAWPAPVLLSQICRILRAVAGRRKATRPVAGWKAGSVNSGKTLYLTFTSAGRLGADSHDEIGGGLSPRPARSWRWVSRSCVLLLAARCTQPLRSSFRRSRPQLDSRRLDSKSENFC